ncbi:MAG: UTP--glucose-1-phosphate uridylyltransferase [Elusimicrobia bacterium]|jgi:UTP--glucose-1-phosphate uridylyltransferase|nr:UTP--glucose-1-phosphate uridylyltransferase [Elusimicrobiota bacterium]
MGKEMLTKYKYQKEQIEGLIKSYSDGEFTKDSNVIKGNIEFPPAESFKELPPAGREDYNHYHEKGINAIKKGRLGVVILYGGMATRFGGVVKGTVEVFDGKSFLELKIRDSLKVSDNIKFYIMNSFSTEQKTREHFEKNNYFGARENIKMFNQFIAPRINPDGSSFQPTDEPAEEKNSYYGPGHGDFPYAFKESGMLEKFISAGGRYVFFSNVDNLGARVDPAILGRHISKSVELTAEVAQKEPGDEGGAPAVVDGRLKLVEGFSFPPEFDDSAIPVFNCSTYWMNASGIGRNFNLPWYVVEKEVDGSEVIQFEHLAGDLTGVLETGFLKVDRSERFFPIKRSEDLEENRSKLKSLMGY